MIHDKLSEKLNKLALECEKCKYNKFTWIEKSPWHEEIISNLSGIEKTGKIIKSFLGYCKQCEWPRELTIEKF